MLSVVRVARPDDASAIARVHADSWRATYDGVLPDRYLAGLDSAALAVRWKHRIETGASVLVGEHAGAVVGFALAGACVNDESLVEFAGEVYMLYVHPYHQRTGLGSALLGAAEGALAAHPFYWLVVWVVEKNREARSFYERHQLRADGARRIDRFLGRAVDVLRYVKPLNPVIDYAALFARKQA